MNWLLEIFTANSVAHSILVLSLVIAGGLALGSFKAFGISLGVAGVLFSGLLFAHFGITIDPMVMEFAREFGLIVFVYTIGMQVGPGFFASLKRQGLPLNLMALAIVLLGTGMTLLVSRYGRIELPIAAGLLAGGTTNTPSLAAAQQILEGSDMPGLGYAVAYPFGILGVIIVMLLVRAAFRVDLKDEKDKMTLEDRRSKVRTMNLEVRNENLFGRPLKSVPNLEECGVVVSRIYHEGSLEVAEPDSILRKGDVILAVGPKEGLENVRVIVGVESALDLQSLPSRITSRRILLTRKSALGKTLDELDLLGRFGVTVTRVSRAEIELTPSSNFRLQYADTLLAVGEEEDIKKAARELGDSPKQLNHPHVIPIFVGIALGVVLGGVPFYMPGVPAPVKLGLAGGPLLVAIVLSRMGSLGPLVWYMPTSANFMLREVGLTLFLACVGLKSGDRFAATLVEGNGLYWMACASLITIVPLLLAGFFARAVLKLNYLLICGVLSGSMTDPPALAFANSNTNSNIPSVSYATVYPLTMILRVVAVQVILLLSR